MNNTKFTGKVLWWDDRHKEGQIITTNGIKFYFNYSVIDQYYNLSIKRNDVLKFEKDLETIANCAINVFFL
jgi:hypothetical protein